jgi:hypothetical protein
LAVHVPGLVCAVLAGGLTWTVVEALRAWDVPLIPRLALTGSVVAVVGVALLWRFPRLLGPSGEWLLQILREMFVRRFGTPRTRNAEA